jgi:hypothetical protein
MKGNPHVSSSDEAIGFRFLNANDQNDCSVGVGCVGGSILGPKAPNDEVGIARRE